MGIGIGIGWPNASGPIASSYPLSVCSRILIQGGTTPAYGTLTFTSLDGNGYPQYEGIVGSGFQASLQYGTYPGYPTRWLFSTLTQVDLVTSESTTSLDPTTVTYAGYSLLSGACPIV